MWGDDLLGVDVPRTLLALLFCFFLCFSFFPLGTPRLRGVCVSASSPRCAAAWLVAQCGTSSGSRHKGQSALCLPCGGAGWPFLCL